MFNSVTNTMPFLIPITLGIFAHDFCVHIPFCTPNVLETNTSGKHFINVNLARLADKRTGKMFIQWTYYFTI